MKEKEIHFENSFARLEEILEKMNSGKTTLNESLTLYEEATKLINACTDGLNSAETRIEQLIKSRSGDLQLDDQGQPVKSAFEQVN